MATTSIQQLLAAYMAGTISKEDLMEMRRCVNRMSRTELSELLQSEWMKQGEPEAIYRRKAEALYKEIQPKLNLNNQHNSTQTKMARMPLWQTLLKYAAVAAILLLGAFTLYFYQDHKAVNQMMAQEVVISSPQGQRAKATLPDGTVVDLNSNSEIRYKQTFGQSDRHITFTGEGYFVVAKNAAMPFLIHSNDMQIEVLGTTFNFYNYRTETLAEVALLEGRVKVETSGVLHQTAFLLPNEKLTLDKRTGQLTKTATPAIATTMWTNPELQIEAMPLGEVIQLLSRRYRTKISVDQNPLLDDRYTGTYTNKSLDEILNILKLHYGLTIHRTADSDSIHLSFE